jgi:hypothetical protein
MKYEQLLKLLCLFVLGFCIGFWVGGEYYFQLYS